MTALSSAASGAATGSSFGVPGALIGGGIGLLSGLFNQPQQQITTPNAPPGYAGAATNAMNFGQGAATNPNYQAAMQLYQQLGQSGNPAVMNQYLQNYMQQMAPYYNLLQQQASMNSNQQATVNGAYGGSGSAINAGAASGAIAAQEPGQAMSAYQQSLQNMYNAAQGYMQIPGAQMQLMLGGLGGMSPLFGTTTSIPSQFNPLQAALGGAVAGYGFGSGMGGGAPSGANLGLGFPQPAGNNTVSAPQPLYG